jgi:hypothetical protein
VDDFLASVRVGPAGLIDEDIKDGKNEKRKTRKVHPGKD